LPTSRAFAMMNEERRNFSGRRGEYEPQRPRIQPMPFIGRRWANPLRTKSAAGPRRFTMRIAGLYFARPRSAPGDLPHEQRILIWRAGLLRKKIIATIFISWSFVSFERQGRRARGELDQRKGIEGGTTFFRGPHGPAGGGYSAGFWKRCEGFIHAGIRLGSRNPFRRQGHCPEGLPQSASGLLCSGRKIRNFRQGYGSF